MGIVAVVLLAGACASIAALAVRRRARRTRSSSTARVDATPEAIASTMARDQLEGLRLQDVVLYDGNELLVTGLARCEEREQQWCESRLVDGSVERWLLLRPEDADAALIGERTPDLGLGPEPSETVEYAGKLYQLERCGQATVSSEGDMGSNWADGEHRYWDYRRPGSDRLWIRRGPQGITSFAGQRVRRHLICVLPAS